jgi:uncharacterized protein (DUF362 family)
MVSSELKRRDLLAAGLGSMVLARCSSLERCREAPRVSILRAAGYTQDLYDLLRRVLSEHRVDVKGKRVLLKPNLVEFDPGTTVNTHPMLVHAALEAFRATGAAEVRIAEGPGHRRATMDLAEAAGYFETIPRFEDLFTDLNLDEVSQVRLSRPSSRLTSIYLPHTALASDLLVSLPKMKTHHWVGATLGMKNLFGLVPGAVYGWPKNVLHWAGINECIVDLHAAFPKHFCIVDGIVGMEGNGPIQGRPKPAGVVVAGASLPAVDATCCRIMGIDPFKIAYLKSADARSAAGEIIPLGESIRSVRTNFDLIPQFRSLRLGARDV